MKNVNYIIAGCGQPIHGSCDPSALPLKGDLLLFDADGKGKRSFEVGQRIFNTGSLELEITIIVKACEQPYIPKT